MSSYYNRRGLERPKGLPARHFTGKYHSKNRVFGWPKKGIILNKNRSEEICPVNFGRKRIPAAYQSTLLPNKLCQIPLWPKNKTRALVWPLPIKNCNTPAPFWSSHVTVACSTLLHSLPFATVPLGSASAALYVASKGKGPLNKNTITHMPQGPKDDAFGPLSSTSQQHQTRYTETVDNQNRTGYDTANCARRGTKTSYCRPRHGFAQKSMR